MTLSQLLCFVAQLAAYVLECELLLVIGGAIAGIRRATNSAAAAAAAASASAAGAEMAHAVPPQVSFSWHAVLFAGGAVWQPQLCISAVARRYVCADSHQTWHGISRADTPASEPLTPLSTVWHSALKPAMVHCVVDHLLLYLSRYSAVTLLAWRPPR
jgi:hypothetical protein